MSASAPAELSRVYVRPEIKVIAFVDCCGYSAYTDVHGDAAGVAIYLQMREAIEREAAEAGIVVVKWTGDGAMLAADSSTAMLTCLYRTMLALRVSAPLALRGGLTVGQVRQVTWDGADYFGAAVNRAARLCGAAAPWQVRASLSASQLSMHFTLRAPQSTEVSVAGEQ